MTQSKILVFAGSTRADSINEKLAKSASAQLTELGCDVTHISLKDFPLPLYDGDLEAEQGVPENATKLAELMHAHDGFFIACPEYNGSLSPLLKNTIDWVTRVPAGDKGLSPFRRKVAAIGAASPGGMGGISMLYHLREILVRLGTLVVSEQVAVGNAGSAFDEHNKITHERTAGFMDAACNSLAEKTALMKGK